MADMSVKNRYDDCEICRDVWCRFADSNFEHKIDIGAPSSCPRHKILIDEFKAYCRQNRNIHSDKAADLGITARGRLDESLTLTESISKLGHCWHLLLLKQESDPQHPGNGCLLDPQWVDLSLLKRWKYQCLSQHGNKCVNPMKVPPISPAWLVDVENGCIIPGEARNPYVALSHRWGEANFLHTTTEIMARLREPEALLNSEVSKNIPTIVRHAMHITKALGERYLWVDAVCIDHSDAAGTTEQLSMMGCIFANALVTILAADGDAQSGIVGLKDISPPRDLHQKRIMFGEETIVVRNTGIFSLGAWTPYFKRAWTFQEQYVSSRKVIFRSKEVHWECQCCTQHEELVLGAEVDKYINPRPGEILAGFPDMDALSHTIMNYNKRELSFDADALFGITGLLAIFSRTFRGGFLYGCPEMLFDRALGWSPIWDHADLRRRTLSAGSVGHSLMPAALPSWSWVGWQGMAWFAYGEASRINHRQNYIEETFPITEWFTSSSPSGASRRRIRSTWFQDRNANKDTSKPLPEGWTRCDVSTLKDSHRAPQLWPDGCDGKVYKHCNMTNGDNDHWYYPFPVAAVDESIPFHMPAQTAYISCKTQRARLNAYRVGKGNTVELCTDQSRTVVGTLRLHNHEQAEGFPGPFANTDEVTGKEVELVAIYRSKKYSKIWDETAKCFTEGQQVSESYQVLWIEWVDEVAYRLASGSVERMHWETLQDLEDIDLVLG